MRKTIFWGILSLVHIIFLVYQANHDRYELVDSKEYIFASKNLISHGILYSDSYQPPLRTDHLTKRPIIYPLFLALFIYVPGAFFWVAFFQSILSLINIFLLLKILRFLRPQSDFTKPLLPILLLYPAQFIYANLLMSEIVFQTLLMVCTYCLLLTIRTKQIKYLWIYTFSLLLGIFCKPVLYLFVFLHLVGIGYWAWKWQVRKMYLVAILPLLIVFSYAKWNEQKTSYFHFSSIQNKSLIQYTTFYLLQSTEGTQAAVAFVDAVEAKASNLAWDQGQQYMQQQAVEVISSYPISYISLHLKGMLNYFLDPGRFDLYHFLGKNDPKLPGLSYYFSQSGYKGIWEYLHQQPIGLIFLLMIVLCMQGIKFLAWLGMFFLPTISITEKIIITILPLYLAGITGLNGASRFMVPVGLLMLIGIALQWEFWIKARVNANPQ